MINRLKRKFILLATVSMFVLMAFLLVIMNSVNYSAVVSESDTVLDMLMQRNPLARFDSIPPANEPIPESDFPFTVFPHGMSPEVPYESRYFSVIVTPDGKILESDLSRIISVNTDSVGDYIAKAVHTGRDHGFVGGFRYASRAIDIPGESHSATQYLFLDCGRKLDAYRTFLWTSIAVGLFGCILVFVAFLFAAGRIVRPIAENYEKQRRFVSDAGHEMKTPLTIIRANLDLLDTESEEISEIRIQTDRLTKLTQDLVFLSKTEESAHTLPKIEMPLSDIVRETAASFHAPCSLRHIAYNTDIMPAVAFCGSPDMIRQLVSVLLENAVKYTPDGGIIRLSLSALRGSIRLTVFNTTADKIEADDLPRFFDRFYRSDASRNSETGGHGIGLSIAKAITEAHNGAISASTVNGYDFTVTASF